MPDIVLSTLNAKYAHAAFGLRYLMANLGELRERAAILEFDINQRPLDVVEGILGAAPKIVGLGVYIWNAEPMARVVADLKRISPQTIVVLGGPEVSHETEQQEIARLADYVITGEGDLAFAELCETLLSGRRPLNKIIAAELPEFAPRPGISPAKKCIVLPYDLYDDRDVANRVIYVEASRGCPFHCEFCLSSLDAPVRNVPLETFLPAMQSLLDRGVRHFKFVDRTFNLNLNFSRAILEFFWQRYSPGLFLHFEMIPDRLPEALREPIARFPAGALQFEVGIQTFNEEVSARISRRQDNAKLAENLRFLREKTGVHVHADLIVGLPGEDIEGFARGFDRLVELGPQEIQVGILKRLRGTPIVRHDAQWEMVYSPHPPYEVLRTGAIDFATMQKMRRFSRYWDLVCNSGNFRRSHERLWNGDALALEPHDGQLPRNAVGQASSPRSSRSPFWSFMEFCEALFARFGRSHAIALPALAEALFRHLVEDQGRDANVVAQDIWADYQHGGRSDMPEFLRPYLSPPDRGQRRRVLEDAGLRRQARHRA